RFDRRCGWIDQHEGRVPNWLAVVGWRRQTGDPFAVAANQVTIHALRFAVLRLAWKKAVERDSPDAVVEIGFGLAGRAEGAENCGKRENRRSHNGSYFFGEFVV